MTRGNNQFISELYYSYTASFYDSITKCENRNYSTIVMQCRGCISPPSTKGYKTIHHLWDTCFGNVWMHLQDADAVCSLSPTLSYYWSLITGSEITGCQLTVATQHPHKTDEQKYINYQSNVSLACAAKSTANHDHPDFPHQMVL